ncbi:hypothetical protein SPRG_02827 [Saprolegnia parasitica CBS 223.65]|uniref:Uncharacterized protein n=1 Tax=Saprolegnia parasitica (strain CBS 223.65) TaxID=695850 RepID=A0A067CNS7_SAPPC|nr:hypothetical protein SPRG_02827 [Saprolegnia parasitica CBS 223.65]KDO32349.1 hypothetical protein SPRG_02827 [Saprolegnia parasitica CBS 223.65]|eukprot:XP_012196804.1 hypothetical protein SPRG_02827 [Saprolegnia parasitica CBS 223.65]
MHAIHPAPPEALVPTAVVVWDRTSVFLSVALAANLVSTPLKAYLCESFPWQANAPPPILSTNASWAVKEAFLLSLTADRYNDSVFTGDANYYEDVLASTVVYRRLLTRPISPITNCAFDVATHVNGGLFLSLRTQSALCGFAASIDSPMLRSCFETRTMGTVDRYGCLWSARRHGSDSNATLWLYSAFQLNASHDFLIGKLVFRIVLTLYMARRVWVEYYAHYAVLRTQCARLPHAATCKIYIGDPTSIFLLHPVVCLCLAIDMWLSVNVVANQVVAVLQLESLSAFLFGYFYLSRCVWLCYACMACTSVVLKRCHWEHVFPPMDPTLVAVVATALVGPLTYLQGNSMCIQAYAWVLNVSASSPNATEGAYAVLLYTCSIGALPLVHGALQYALCRRRYGAQRGLINYASHQYNDVKSLVVLALPFRSLGRVPHTCGGSLYHVFDQFPGLKRSPCISQRGTDCFVLVLNCAKHPLELRRLSLLYHGLDRTRAAQAPNVVATKGPVIFGHVELQTSCASSRGTRIVLLESSLFPSPWIE